MLVKKILKNILIGIASFNDCLCAILYERLIGYSFPKLVDY